MKIINWIRCRLGFHDLAYIKIQHCDDMSTHDLRYCSHCKALFFDERFYITGKV